MNPITSLILAAAAALPLAGANAAEGAPAEIQEGPKAHASSKMTIQASHGIFYRLAKDEIRKRLLLETSMNGAVGNEVEWVLDDTGREYLGTCPRNDVDTAFQRFEAGGEDIDIVVEYAGSTYMDRLELGGMGKVVHTKEDGGGLKYDAAKNAGQEQRRDGLLFTGIIDINYPDREFEIECDLLDTDLDCEVYSVGMFEPPNENDEQRRRRRLESGYPTSCSCKEIESGNKDQCSEDSDCRSGQECKTFSGTKRCTCNENNGEDDTYHDNYDCMQVWDFTWYNNRYKDNGNYRSRCSNGGGYCIMYEHVDNSCFSSSMTMTLETGSEVTMKELKVGDRILAADGKTFETVYSIPHKEDNKMATFLQFHTKDDKLIELTPDHMIYVANKKHAVPASTVKVGDLLFTAAGLTTPIIAIDSVQKEGVYAPLTSSGKILVNGIVASCHQTIQPNKEYVEIMNVPIMTQETLFQLAVTPLRLFCTSVAPSMCQTESHDEESGRIAWARIGLTLSKYATDPERSSAAGPLVQVLLLIVSIFVFFFLSLVASVLAVLSNAYGISCLITLVAMKSFLAEFGLTLKTQKLKTV